MESTVVSLGAAILLTAIFGAPPREFLDVPMLAVLVLLVVAAPVLETILLQAFPIFVVRRLQGSLRTQILVSTVLFASLHFPEGVATGVSAGVIGGLYFAFAYGHWRMKSRWLSFWVTAGCHSIHNGIAFIILVVAGNWS